MFEWDDKRPDRRFPDVAEIEADELRRAVARDRIALVWRFAKAFFCVGPRDWRAPPPEPRQWSALMTMAVDRKFDHAPRWLGYRVTREQRLPDTMLEFARELLSIRAIRAEMFGGDLISDPAEGLLLNLYVAARMRETRSVVTASAAASVSATTGQRMLVALADRGLVAADGRHIGLTPHGCEAVERWLDFAIDVHGTEAAASPDPWRRRSAKQFERVTDDARHERWAGNIQ